MDKNNQISQFILKEEEKEFYDFSSLTTLRWFFGKQRYHLIGHPTLLGYDIFKSYHWNIKHPFHSDVHFDAEISILKFSSLTDSKLFHLPPQMSFHHIFKNRSFVSFKKKHTVLQGVLSFFMYSVYLTQFS